MDNTALYQITLLMLIMTSSALEDSALSEKRNQRVKRDNRSNASEPDQPSPINLQSSKWKEYPRWYQQGQNWFPNRNGCGGDIIATEDYQYGSLTSPNWPKHLPSEVECTWRLHGFNSLFFVVNGFHRKSRRTEDGRLTVRIQGKRRKTRISLGGYYLHPKVFLNVKRRVISLTLKTHLMSDISINKTGTKVTWWTVPASNAAFVKIFKTHGSEGRVIKYTDLLSVGNGDTGYVFLFKNDISAYNTVINMTALQNETKISCLMGISTYTISYNEKVKLPGRPTCDTTSSKLTLKVLGYNQPTSTPFGIEINIPKGLSHVNITFKAVLENDSQAYSINQDDNFNIISKNGLVYFGTKNFAAANTSVKYKAGILYNLVIILHTPLVDSFFQFQMQTDIQLSPSCVVDFLQVGGQRVCGVNKPDTYISSPVDNSMMERTGTYYVNILETTSAVFASPSASDNHNATLALIPNPHQCYRSDPGVSSPFWVVDMVEVFLVRGVRIIAEDSSMEVTVAVYMTAKVKPWPVQNYQTCWRGSVTGNSGLHSCPRPVSGQYMAIVKKSASLSLCKVEVYVNIAAPLVAWENVAYKKTLMDEFQSNTSFHKMLDGDPYTCVEHVKEPTSLKYHIDLGHRHFTVQAARLYADSDEPQIGFQIYSSEQRCIDYEGLNYKNLGILVSCTIPMVTNHVFIAELKNLTKLCEVIIYAEVNDKTSVNAALYTEASKSLRSDRRRTSVPEIVDGILTTCDETDDEFFVDLRGMHVVEGVILHMGDDWKKTSQVKVLVYRSTPGDTPMCHEKTYTDTDVLQLMCTQPIVGSHVILQITDNKKAVLHLCELEVIAMPYNKEKGLQNVALFKHVRQGPRFTPPSALVAPHVIYHGTGARLAVDGDRSHDNTILKCTTVLREGQTAAWWEVDLANMYRVKIVGLLLCPGVRPSYQLSIEVSDGRAISQRLCYKGPPRYFVKCTESILGRYVRLQSFQDLCLCEVAVMAAPLSNFERFGQQPRYATSSFYQLLSFVTDGYLEKRGFSSWYKIDNLTDFNTFADCGELVRNHDTTLRSPNYPHGYGFPNDSYICHWMVYTPYDSFTLIYIDELLLAKPVSEDLCFHDVLIISNSAGQQITKCGSVCDEILNMKSYQNSYLHITLMVRNFTYPKNRLTLGRGGMRLHFRTYPNCIYNESKVDPGEVGTLSSPFFPYEPPPYAWCRWILKATATGFMELIFLEWNFETVYSAPGQGCDIELQIRSRRQGMRRFCPNNPPPSVLNIRVQLKDRVTIIFNTTKNVMGQGFLLQYRLISNVQELDYKRTVIESFGYPDSYETQNATLKWRFTSIRIAGIIILTFTDLQLGGGYFNVNSSNTVDSHKLHSLNASEYSKTTSEPLHYPVFPPILFELVFVPVAERDNSFARFQFTFDFVPAPDVNFPNAYAAELSSNIPTNLNSAIRFDRVRLHEHILNVENQFFFIMETGLYVVSMRIVPKDSRSHAFMVLRLTKKNTTLIAYGNNGQIASVTAALKLEKGDKLGVFVNSGQLDIFEHTAFAFVYVSPVEGGFAFAGYQKEVTFNCSIAVDCNMRFSDVFTLVPEKFGLDYKAFITPVEGIYWVTLRPGQTIGDLASIHVGLHKGRSPTFLDSVGKDHVPGSVSAAFHFEKGDELRVNLYEGVSGVRSLFSIVRLAKNIMQYMQTANHIAFTGLLGQCRWINPNHTTLSFNSTHENYGVMQLNSSTFVVPTSGLYIMSIRNDLTDQEGCDGHPPPPDQHLQINVNGRMVVTAFARQNPTEHVTVLRLNKFDMLTVSARGNDTVGKDTLFSFAFVDK